MTVKELDELIEWCKMKNILEKKRYPTANSRYLEGYKAAMLVVMSRLHCLKERDTNGKKL